MRIKCGKDCQIFLLFTATKQHYCIPHRPWMPALCPVVPVKVAVAMAAEWVRTDHERHCTTTTDAALPAGSTLLSLSQRRRRRRCCSCRQESRRR